MQKIKKIAGLTIGGGLLPFISLAAANDINANVINNILDNVLGTLNIVIKIIFALATVVFGWGIVQYISAGGNDEKLKAGRQHMLWGIIGMAAMIAAWGFAKLLIDYFVPNLVGPTIPQF